VLENRTKFVQNKKIYFFSNLVGEEGPRIPRVKD
jgi:hypothetical protein